VAAFSDIPGGEAKAVRLEMVAASRCLTSMDGSTPPTTSVPYGLSLPAAVRHGILTCDWHAWSFDLRAEDVSITNATTRNLPVDIRQDEIWIQPGDGQYKRRDQHLRLLWQGLLSKERWTISKAIALLLKGGVPEEEIVEMVLRHLGRHIASSDEEENGGGVSRLITGLKVGRRYR
jgi:hypothetical protein